MPVEMYPTDAYGNIATLAGAQTFTATKTFLAGSATSTPLLVQATTGQTANLTEWRGPTGTPLVSVNSAGALWVGASAATAGGSPLAGSYMLVNGAGDAKQLVVRGHTTQNASLQEWQNSAGTVLTKVHFNGSIETPTGSQLGTSSNVFKSGGAAFVSLYVQGAAGQTANLAEFQNSAGTVLAAVTRYGALTVTPSGGAHNSIFVQHGDTANPGLILRGAASQTADLAQFQNSAGAILARIGSTGNFELSNPTANNNSNYAVTTSPHVYLESTTWDSAAGNVVQSARMYLAHSRVNVTDPTSLLTFQASRDGVLRDVMGLSGDGWVQLYNANITPATNSAGGTLYIASGELWYRGSNGTSTRLAIA